MWIYEKKLQYPVKIKNPNPQLAKIIISQYGGPDGELGASMRYLSQRFAMPDKKIVGILTDVGTEELAHVEMVSAILYQLTKGMSEEQLLHVTEPFYRTDKARSRAEGGAGLGLALCKNIAEAHGAKLRFESEKGKGTKVFLDFTS